MQVVSVDIFCQYIMMVANRFQEIPSPDSNMSNADMAFFSPATILDCLEEMRQRWELLYHITRKEWLISVAGRLWCLFLGLLSLDRHLHVHYMLNSVATFSRKLTPIGVVAQQVSFHISSFHFAVHTSRRNYIERRFPVILHLHLFV